ncbi:MAG: acyl-CoA thioesterase [Runella slithyformis]|jgi:acyl-CoA hydrolase|nr:MAG: acyl-CoA thioesterase [Runella slithyformis]TAF95885.1 MAG: acyl-CoA thioesterase [Runella sp.]TAG20346.1 MAG: acyl-CoA thioesterase [Cytophagales bacterium]TAG39502.1 MAG: acyl-CoA thioesterase [Cytophagia bacterium]TAF01923.1 MAG: acyl-CoA thioesterase [Runella slithyformis]
MPKSKHVQESLTTMTEMVLPNDTNTLNNLMGGRLLHWMDICAAIAAQKHSSRIVVTASVDNVSFAEAIHLGDIVTIEAKVTRAFNSSMEVSIKVSAQNISAGGELLKTHAAFFTFVAVDQSGRPIEVAPVIVETAEEQELYQSALRRRQLRLVLAGRLKPADATELKNFLNQ